MLYFPKISVGGTLKKKRRGGGGGGGEAGRKAKTEIKGFPVPGRRRCVGMCKCFLNHRQLRAAVTAFSFFQFHHCLFIKVFLLLPV